jgi:hypothetical protein
MVRRSSAVRETHGVFLRRRMSGQGRKSKRETGLSKQHLSAMPPVSPVFADVDRFSSRPSLVLLATASGFLACFTAPSVRQWGLRMTRQTPGLATVFLWSFHARHR